MSTVTVHLTSDTEQKLRQQADRMGQTLETYLERLAERETEGETIHATGKGTPPRYITDPRPTQADFEVLLTDLTTGPRLPVLPADFSRADVYDDHD